MFKAYEGFKVLACLRRSVVVGLLLGAVLAGPTAYADICKAPFMHNDGRLLLTGSGLFRVGADLSFTDVKTPSKGRCEARVAGSANFAFMAFPSSETELDYSMRVEKGLASFQNIEADGQLTPVEGQFDLRLLGLFAYGQPIRESGQTFAPQAFKIQVDTKNPDAAPIVVHTGLKTVGSKETIKTAAGEQACWPIHYKREIEAVQISLGGLKMPLPAMTSQVTDWFCPDLNMVMKQESVQAGVTSVIEVVGIH